MEDNINFNELWAKQKTSPPNREALFTKIKQYKKRQTRQLVLANTLFVLTAGFIVFIWMYYQPNLISTKLGIILIILSMTIMGIAYSKNFLLYRSLSETLSYSEYLKNLLELKKRQVFIQGTMLNIYFVMLSAGLGLYMYEYIRMMSVFWGVFSCTVTAVWILFNWFYLRPRQIKKQQSKLNEIIDKVESIMHQFGDTHN